MKVLFDHPNPFMLAHGGFQIQIEQTKTALENIGLEVDFLRWWDGRQTGDLIHHFSPARTDYLQRARARGLPVVMTCLFSETCNRPNWKLAIQGLLRRAILALPFARQVKHQLTWSAYEVCPHLIVGLEAEKIVLVKVFRVRSSAVSVIPLGLAEKYLNAGTGKRNADHLISTGTITPVKGSVELAALARISQVPVLFVGKPIHPADPYWLKFQSLIDGQWVNYHPHVETAAEMIRLLQSARGFVLFSHYENWSLSASEAVASGLPLLLPDQKWSRERFGSQPRYFVSRSSRENVDILRQFYRECPSLSAPNIKLFGWPEVANRMREVYTAVLSTSR